RLSDRVGVRRPILMGIGLLMLTVAALSTWAGVSPVLIAGLMACVGTGLACIQSPANNAVANALPEEEVGAGMGLFQGTGFLSGASGPAVAGALLAARQEAQLAPWNPLATLEAAPLSDVFLTLLLPFVVALMAARRLRTAARTRRAGGGAAPGPRPAPAAVEPGGGSSARASRPGLITPGKGRSDGGGRQARPWPFGRRWRHGATPPGPGASPGGKRRQDRVDPDLGLLPKEEMDLLLPADPSLSEFG